MADAERPRADIAAAYRVVDGEGNTMLEGGVAVPTGPMHAEEVRFDVAEQLGAAPEDIRFPGHDMPAGPTPGRRAGRMSVAFSADGWNSSWDPGKDKEGDGPIMH